ncbi:MAG: hypothetical protein JNL94_07280 [Planctomycetes bacterium]|nr:hypothetical protein [Planctomycetota bacterium]
MDRPRGTNSEDRPSCPYCPLELGIERRDGDIVWWSCPKCGHVEAHDAPPNAPNDTKSS